MLIIFVLIFLKSTLQFQVIGLILFLYQTKIVSAQQSAHFFEYYDPISLSNINDWDDEIHFSERADQYDKSQMHSVNGLILANNVSFPSKIDLLRVQRNYKINLI